jgi:cell shape-determining protein MreC
MSLTIKPRNHRGAGAKAAALSLQQSVFNQLFKRLNSLSSQLSSSMQAQSTISALKSKATIYIHIPNLA